MTIHPSLKHSTEWLFWGEEVPDVDNPYSGEVISNPSYLSENIIVSGSTLDFSSYNEQPSNQNYIYPTYYKFIISKMPKLEYFITKVTLPDFGFAGPLEQINRFSLIKHPASKVVYGDLSLSFLVDENMESWLELYNWIRKTSVSDDHFDYDSDTKDHFCDATLMITNSAMNPNIEVTFKNIFPTSISGFDFDSSIGELTPWTATVTFAYDYYDVKKI